MKKPILLLVLVLVLTAAICQDDNIMGIDPTPTSTPLSREDATIHIEGAESCGPNCKIRVR